MPDRNSSPANPASAAAKADDAVERRRAGADFVVRRWRSPRAAAEPDRRRPGMPPSRTSRFEPTPITVTGISGGQRREKSGEIGGIGGPEQDFGGSADAEPGLLADRARSRSAGRGPAAGRAINDGLRMRRHATRPGECSAARSPGKLFAQPVIEPAPRQTTMSPGRRQLSMIAGEIARIGQRRGRCGGRARSSRRPERPGSRPRSAPRPRHRYRRPARYRHH